jgi:hypothetical protein
MPAPHDELPTLDLADLSRVTGGAGDDLTSMLLPMMMMRSRSQAAAIAPAPAPATVPPWQPTITVDGVPQQVAAAADGSYTVSA